MSGVVLALVVAPAIAAVANFVIPGACLKDVSVKFICPNQRVILISLGRAEPRVVGGQPGAVFIDDGANSHRIQQGAAGRLVQLNAECGVGSPQSHR